MVDAALLIGWVGDERFTEANRTQNDSRIQPVVESTIE
jgi:hypothetical protein